MNWQIDGQVADVQVCFAALVKSGRIVLSASQNKAYADLLHLLGSFIASVQNGEPVLKAQSVRPHLRYGFMGNYLKVFDQF